MASAARALPQEVDSGMRGASDQPCDLDAERAVLGACLVSEKALGVVLGTVEREDFWSERHRLAFDAIHAAARDSRAGVDHVTVAAYLPESELGKDVKRFLFALVEAVPTASNASRYARAVRDAARARGVLLAADRMREAVHIARANGEGYADVTERALGVLDETVRGSVGASRTDAGTRPISDALDEFERWVEAARYCFKSS